MIWNQLSFQDPTSFTIKFLTDFHDQSITILIFIIIYVAWIILNSLIFHSYSSNPPYEGHELERIWTLIPSLVLIFLALPSLHLLYVIEEFETSYLTIKTTGHQWFWSYEYADYENISDFDSYMLPSSSLLSGEFRLLEVDNRLTLPWGVPTRILVTAADVLHSWAVPRIGIKVDAIPGRLNQVTTTPLQSGIFYGQCSEICGANHSFIPIAIEVVRGYTWLSITSLNN